MNVQLSLTASTSSSANQEPATNAVNARNAEPTNIASTKDLERLERQGKPVSKGEEQLIKAIDKAVKALQGPNTTLDISIHEKTHEIMVKVLNKDTGEIIREVPPEKTLDLAAKMMELAGILIDERV